MYSWNWEPGPLIGLALQAGAYLVCVGPLRRRFPGSAAVPLRQILFFLLGVLILFVALVSPIEKLADDYLLSAHMVQHLLMTLLAPPLLLSGTPRWLLRPLLRLPFALQIGRRLTNPLVAFLAFNLIFSFWHVPNYYDRALQSRVLHIIEHVVFFGSATLMWWPIFSPLDELPRLPEPGKCLYLFLASLPPTILGALITFAQRPLYQTYWQVPTYLRLSEAWGLDPLTDQQLGGLIMWIPGALVYFVVLTAIFIRWLDRDEFDPGPEVYRSNA